MVERVECASCGRVIKSNEEKHEIKYQEGYYCAKCCTEYCNVCCRCEEWYLDNDLSKHGKEVGAYICRNCLDDKIPDYDYNGNSDFWRDED